MCSVGTPGQAGVRLETPMLHKVSHSLRKWQVCISCKVASTSSWTSLEEASTPPHAIMPVAPVPTSGMRQPGKMERGEDGGKNAVEWEGEKSSKRRMLMPCSKDGGSLGRGWREGGDGANASLSLPPGAITPVAAPKGWAWKK